MEMMFKIALGLVFFTTGVLGDGHSLCAFSKKDNVKYHPNLTKHNNKLSLGNSPLPDDEHAGQYVDSNNTEHCAKDDPCYALWQEDVQNKSIVILIQGCWDSSGDTNCDHSECIAYKKPSKALNNAKFCCCSGNLCNINVTDGYVVPPPDLVQTPAWEAVNHMSYKTQIIIAVVAVLGFIFMGIFTFIFARLYCNSPKRSNESLHLMEAPPPLCPNFDLDTLKIQETVGRGRYGSVCRGVLNDHTVAVKVFCYQNRQYFLNERDIYTLPHMEHPALPSYIGSDERIGINGRPEYLLVVSFSPVGCLQDFLRNTTIDFARLCKMALSITRGLAHLHTECGKGEKAKPCVAHRDLTSRNILVKPDGSCMLCDFGFAIRISGAKYYHNGEEQVAENTSLADVGTLRYMAPEILEGAVNLRDCESSLKQIDVYALGLVLWEIATRCSDLFQGVEVPGYQLPFEAEVGLHPGMEQMQALVVKHKARPLFPDIWKDTNPAARALKETIEDCWDQDAEARLTTLCVEERIIELPVIWERHKAGLGIPGGVSPTFNPTSNLQKSNLALTKTENISDGLDQSDLLICPRERTNSLSECTVETLLSPSEPNNVMTTTVDWKNSINISNSIPTAKVTIPIQPHQGRNPCLARNLMANEKPMDSNTFLDTSMKFTVDKNIRSFSDGDASRISVPNRVSGPESDHSHRNPIPYVQNRTVSDTIPKQSNVPGHSHQREPPTADKRWGPFQFFKKKVSFNGIRNLLERKPTCKSNGNLPEEQQPLKTPGSCISPISPTGNGTHNPVNMYWISNDVKENDRLVNTEVRLSKPNNSAATVRSLNDGNDKNEDSINNNRDSGIAAKMEGGDAKSLPDALVIDQDLGEKFKRPTTLPVQVYQNGHSDENDVEDCILESGAIMQDTSAIMQGTGAITMRRKGSGGKRKGVKRVKTPFEIKSRFSLYDDRIMSSQELPASNVGTRPQMDHTKFSVSVPMDMDALCASEHQPIELKDNCKTNFTADTRMLQNIVSLCDI